MPNRHHLFLFAILITLSGCSFTNMGRDLGAGLGEGIGPQADSIAASLGGGLVRGARDTLTSQRTRDSLENFIDSLLTTAGLSANKSVTALRDTLMGPYTRAWLLSLEKEVTADIVLAAANLSDTLLGSTTLARITRLRDTLIGDYTAAYVASLRDTVLGEPLRKELGLLRDELLGPKTRAAIDSILADATARLQTVSHEEQSFLKRNITEILWVAGAIIAGLLILGGLIVAKVKRYRRMIETVTHQIHNMPDQKAYDDLTGKIQNKTQEQALEKEFREILTKQGLKGDGSWKA